MSFVLIAIGALGWVFGQGATLDAAATENRHQTISLAQARARTLAQRRSNSFIHDHILSVFVSLTAGLNDSAQLRRAARQALQALDAQTTTQRGETGSSALFDQLRQQAQTLCQDVAVSTDATREHAVPGPVAQALTDAATEALRNSLRHAGDENHPQVLRRITLRSDNHGLAITVTDNGCGFDPAASIPGRHGLTGSIQRRLNDVSAQASIESAPGRGTTVAMSWNPPASGQQVPHPAVSRVDAWPQSIASSMQTTWARLIGSYVVVAHVLTAVLEIRSGSYITATPVAASLVAYVLAAYLLLNSWPQNIMPCWAILLVLIVVATIQLAVLLVIRTSLWPDLASWVTGAANILCCGLLMRNNLKTAWVGETLLVVTTAIWVLLTHRPVAVILTFTMSHIITLALWHLVANRCSAANAALTLTQARTAEVLALRQANATADRVMATAMTSVRHRASPLLTRIATSQSLTTHLRTQARLLEAELRDEIRAPFFTGTPVVHAARHARAHGTEVILLDDRGDQPLPHDTHTQVIEHITQILITDHQHRIVVRMLPAARPHLASILTDSTSLVLGADGRVISRP